MQTAPSRRDPQGANPAPGGRPPTLGRAGHRRPAVLLRRCCRSPPPSASSLSLLRPVARLLRRGQPGRVLRRARSGRRCSTRRRSGAATAAGHAVTTTMWALVVCIPFGLGSAIYLSEYAAPARAQRRSSRRSRCSPASHRRLRLLRADLHHAAAAGRLARSATRTRPVQRAWSAGLVMGIMILPTVASLSEDAMSAVPQGLRAGRVCARQHASSRSHPVVVPAALSGIVASFVLGISRAVGETMIVLIAAGATPTSRLDPREGDADDDRLHRRQPASVTCPRGRPGTRPSSRSGPLLFVITLS